MMKQQNFLKSAAARSLSLAQIFRLSDDEAYGLLKSHALGRWGADLPALRRLQGL